jgi:hypothetical protein
VIKPCHYYGAPSPSTLPLNQQRFRRSSLQQRHGAVPILLQCSQTHILIRLDRGPLASALPVAVYHFPVADVTVDGDAGADLGVCADGNVGQDRGVGFDDAGFFERRAGVDGGVGVQEDGGADGRLERVRVRVGRIGGEGRRVRRGTPDHAPLGYDGAGVDD